VSTDGGAVVKKVFIVAGELSGDMLGAWYLKTRQIDAGKEVVKAVGGSFLEAAGAELYERYETLNVVGVVEIIKHLRSIFRVMNRLAAYAENFDEVIVVDFPGFNLRLIKKLKKRNPSIKITYLSPPQLWVWGKWRIGAIKKYCDDIIVLYPFEVDWYKKHGVSVRWIGYPFLKDLSGHFEESEKKECKIAVIPGSRSLEVKRMFPFFLKIIRRMKLAHPSIRIVIPIAESTDRALIEKMVKRANVGWIGQDVLLVEGKKEKLEALRTCCCALTKPGTITLELALLSVPAIVAYRASFLTYWVARLLVKVDYMSLPNLLLGKEVYPEFIQGDCKEKKVLLKTQQLYQKFLSDKAAYEFDCLELKKLRELFEFPPR
jgi:lipid-A-disaccharide synthase